MRRKQRGACVDGESGNYGRGGGQERCRRAGGVYGTAAGGGCGVTRPRRGPTKRSGPRDKEKEKNGRKKKRGVPVRPKPAGVWARGGCGLPPVLHRPAVGRGRRRSERRGVPPPHRRPPIAIASLERPGEERGRHAGAATTKQRWRRPLAPGPRPVVGCPTKVVVWLGYFFGRLVMQRLRGGWGGGGLGGSGSARVPDGCESASGKAWRGSRGCARRASETGAGSQATRLRVDPASRVRGASSLAGVSRAGCGSQPNYSVRPLPDPVVWTGGWDKRPCA